MNMNSSKAIDISKSSLIGLKAELLKKQDEVKKLKELHKNNVKPAVQQKKTSQSQKPNKGVEERSLKDVEQSEEDLDMLQKSRELLVAKARLYDKLKENEGDINAKAQCLIDFGLKKEIYSNENIQNAVNESASQASEEEDGHSDSNSDPENDWVDFVDTLGRSRRCLRKDLSEMKVKDAKLAASLRPPSPPPVAEVTPELLSWDMQREILRKKWEEQETVLLGKKDIHYQDVLFDEARPHGVGYFGFSTEESERLRQQQELNNMRKETMEQQEAAVGLRVRRQQQLEARLAAARRRKRERLGLPPEEPEPAVETEVSVSCPEDEKLQPEKIEDLEETIKKIAPIRPWDIGKQDNNLVMSQEEWVEKKRSERHQEFAPPSSLLEPPEHSTWGFNRRNEIINVNNRKTDSETIKPTFHSPNPSNMGLFQKNVKKEVFKSKNSMQQFNRDIANKNDSTSSMEKINEFCTRNKKTEPTSEDIDELLSATREKFENHNERKYTRDNLARFEEIRSRKNVAIESLKVTNDMNNESFTENTDEDSGVWNNYNTHTTVSATEGDIINEVTAPERDNGMSEILVKQRMKDPNTGDVPCFETALRNKRKGAEIPPPSSMSYYNDAPTSHKQHTSSRTDLLESISVGLNFLKSKEKKETRVKGLLDIL